MCGRVVAATPRERLMELFGAGEAVGELLPPSFNVAPGATVYAVAGIRGGGRRVGTMRWGLVPSWAANPDEGPKPINAKVETLLDKALFAESLARRRVVIPVDGFYEWRHGAGGKQPFLFRSPDGAPLALAGLWDRWQRDRWQSKGRESADTPLVTFTIVTTTANDDVAPLHDRMPAILDGDAIDRWLDPNGGRPQDLLAVLRPAPAGALAAIEVSRRVNDARNDDQELTNPALA